MRANEVFLNVSKQRHEHFQIEPTEPARHKFMFLQFKFKTTAWNIEIAYFF